MNHDNGDVGGERLHGSDSGISKRYDQIKPGLNELACGLMRRVLVRKISNLELDISSFLVPQAFQPVPEGLNTRRDVIAHMQHTDPV